MRRDFARRPERSEARRANERATHTKGNRGFRFVFELAGNEVEHELGGESDPRPRSHGD